MPKIHVKLPKKEKSILRQREKSRNVTKTEVWRWQFCATFRWRPLRLSEETLPLWELWLVFDPRAPILSGPEWVTGYMHQKSPKDVSPRALGLQPRRAQEKVGGTVAGGDSSPPLCPHPLHGTLSVFPPEVGWTSLPCIEGSITYLLWPEAEGRWEASGTWSEPGWYISCFSTVAKESTPWAAWGTQGQTGPNLWW